MQSKATSVEAYLQELPEDRRIALEKIRSVILKNLAKGFQEAMQYGMIGYSVPHSLYPDGYHCDPKEPLPFAAVASQKQHISIYMMSLYSSPEDLEWFQSEWEKTGKKLNMGKSCIRFKKLEDIPLELIGKAFKRVTVKKYIAIYEQGIKKTKSSPEPKAKSTKKKAR